MSRSHDLHERMHQMIEDKSLDWRAMIERSYSANPKVTHSELAYMGYGTIAAQLKIDHQAGRLP